MSSITLDRQMELEVARLTRRVRSPWRSFVVRVWRRVVQAIEERHGAHRVPRVA